MKKKLPTELTTVTSFSKTMALALFIITPMIAFYLGMQYQETADYVAKQTYVIQNPPVINHPTPTPSPIPIPKVLLPRPAQNALKDVTKTLGVQESDIIVVSIEEKEWNDASLGCPQQGKMYAQVVTPGYKVVFSYNHPLAEMQKAYEYHTDKTRTFVFCGD